MRQREHHCFSPPANQNHPHSYYESLPISSSSTHAKPCTASFLPCFSSSYSLVSPLSQHPRIPHLLLLVHHHPFLVLSLLLPLNPSKSSFPSYQPYFFVVFRKEGTRDMIYCSRVSPGGMASSCHGWWWPNAMPQKVARGEGANNYFSMFEWKKTKKKKKKKGR